MNEPLFFRKEKVLHPQKKRFSIYNVVRLHRFCDFRRKRCAPKEKSEKRVNAAVSERSV